LRFEERVGRVVESLPPELRAAVRNIEISVEDEHPDDPDLFGLYEGVPLPERGDWAGALPDRIRIFRLPLVESFPDPAELEEEIRVTVLHELAHYFGIDEDRLDELGFA
jgi:predicted Zn-dependent protease with MMP-like domain